MFIAGSTQAPEEEIALGVFRRLHSDFPRLRLILVPRQKDRFDEVAALLKRAGEPFARRSAIAACGLALACGDASAKPQAAVVLVDTIGELGALWGLAD